jgi:hypothetical protein
MKTPLERLVLPALLAVGLVHATASERNSDSESSSYFSLMPKAFQSRPQLDMTVVTTVTDAGRLVAPAAPDHPAYYVAQSVGYREFGDPDAGVHPPPPADLERAMKKALASQGYLPATDAAHRPSLLVVFTWGVHYKLSPKSAGISPLAELKNRLERAALVGGYGFARQVEKAYAERAFSQLTPTDMPAPMIDPVYRLTHQDTKTEYLIYQVYDDLYFVVASAYDYASVAQGKHTLLWRTNMTANTVGVNMKETLPPLIATAAPFFGRETAGTEALQRRINRKGTVDVGQPTVLEYMDSSAPVPTAPQADATKP